MKNALAILLILFGTFGVDGLKTFVPKVVPKPTPEVSILNIDRPSNENIELTKQFGVVVTDLTDRAKLAIFNHEFAVRVKGYDTSLQKINDVYVLAAQKFFKNSMVGKYKGLSDMIVQQLESISSNDDHTLSIEEKQKISDRFMAIAWTLIQKAK